MKKGISAASLLVSLSFIFLVCNDKPTEPSETITAKPVVKKTSINYDQVSFIHLFPDTASLNSISTSYTNNYTEELRCKILDYMKGEVDKLGEDVNIFDSILNITGCKQSGGYMLPTYAEKAQYENQDAWVFQVTYGLGEPNFGHFRCFVFSAASLDTLIFIQCR